MKNSSRWETPKQRNYDNSVDRRDECQWNRILMNREEVDEKRQRYRHMYIWTQMLWRVRIEKEVLAEDKYICERSAMSSIDNDHPVSPLVTTACCLSIVSCLLAVATMCIFRVHPTMQYTYHRLAVILAFNDILPAICMMLSFKNHTAGCWLQADFSPCSIHSSYVCWHCLITNSLNFDRWISFFEAFCKRFASFSTSHL